MTKRQKFLSALGQFFKDFFTKNIILKIVVVLFAVLLWGFVIAEENPEYIKTVSGVTIQIRNEDKLAESNWMVESVNGTTADLLTTDVDVRCPLRKHNTLNKSELSNCYIDLAEKNIPDNESLDYYEAYYDVKCVPESGYGKAVNFSVNQVLVRFTRTSRIENRIVKVVPVGENPSGLRVVLPEQVTLASLTGKQSEIERVDTIKVRVDISEFAGSEPGFYPNNKYDVEFYEKGSTVPFSKIDGKTVQVGVSATVYAYKQVPVRVPVNLSKEFETMYTCTVDLAETYMIGLQASDESILDDIDVIETEAIDPEMKVRTVTRYLSLTVPDKVQIVDAPNRITAYISVSEIMEEKEYPVVIQFSETNSDIYLKDGHRQTVTIRVKGSVNAMEAFNESWLSAFVSISAYRQGTYRLPIVIRFEGSGTEYEYTLVDPVPDEDGVGYIEVVLAKEIQPASTSLRSDDRNTQ